MKRTVREAGFTRTGGVNDFVRPALLLGAADRRPKVNIPMPMPISPLNKLLLRMFLISGITQGVPKNVKSALHWQRNYMVILEIK